MADEWKKRFTGIVSTMIKFAVAAAVIFWFYHTKAGDLRAGFASFDYLTIIPALLFSLIATFAASLRWRALAGMINIPLSRFQAFSLTMQGMFFSLVIPGGAVGGDVVKMAALTGHIKAGSRTEGIFSILMDRIVGMIALFLLALILLVYSRMYFTDLHFPNATGSPAGIALWWFLSGICTAGLAAGFAVFMHRFIEKLPGIRKLFAFADKKSNGKITRLSIATDTYAGNCLPLIFWITATLFVIHLFPALSMICLLNGSGVEIRFLPVISAVVIGNIAGLMPLFPGGVGIRDAVTVALLVSAGYPLEAAGTAQLLSTLLLVTVNLAGSVFFIIDRKKTEAAE